LAYLFCYTIPATLEKGEGRIIRMKIWAYDKMSRLQS